MVFGLLLATTLLLAVVVEGGQDGRSVGTPASNAFLQSLTEIERAWLRDHPVIRVVQDPDWPPVEFADERGEPSGMAGDYLSLVEQRLGVKFERVRNLSWQEAYARLKRWEIDMTTSVTVTPERTEFWAFTKPYMEIPNVIFADRDVTYIADMRELAGKKVAVVDGYAISEWISRDFPDIQLVKVKNVQEGLEKLQGREVSAYVGEMLVSSYYLTRLKMTTLKIAGNTSYVNAQSMAVRKDWAILAGILDKALDTISKAERNDIYRRWLPIRYEYGFDYRMFWRALAVFAVILLGLMFWIRKLAKEIRHRKEAEAASNESARRFRQLFDVAAVPLCLVDKEGVLLDFNDRLVQAFGYTREDISTLAEWWQLAYPDPDYRRWVVETWDASVRRARENNADIEPIEYRMTCKSGEIRTMMITGTFLGDDFLAAFFDVTERKRAEEEIRTLLTAVQQEKIRLSALIDSITDEVWFADTEGKFVIANPSALREFGIVTSAGGIDVEKLAASLEVYRPDGSLRPVEEAPPLRALKGEMVMNLEEIIRTPAGGELRYRQVNAAPVRDATGNIVGSVSVVRDITDRKIAEEKLINTLESLRKAVNTTIQVMVSAVEIRDPYTSGHQIRSADLARAIATEMGLPQEKIDGLRMAGSIHDIGKLSIPAEILSKPTKLSEIEFLLIKEHARKGYEMLKNVESPWPLAEIVYQHHERMDGSGYPRNLKGDEILIEARILAVADVVEAMASHRPYRPGWGIDAALNEIEKNRGIFYDAAVADACLRLFREKSFKLEGA